MKPAAEGPPWTSIIGLLIVIGVVSLASCRNLERLRQPMHEPAIAPRTR